MSDKEQARDPEGLIRDVEQHPDAFQHERAEPAMNDTNTPSAAKYDLPKAYEFAEVEERWYQYWLDHRAC